MSKTMTPEQIFSQFIKPNQHILHLGGDPELKELTQAHTYTRLEIADLTDYANIPEGPYDYVVLSDVLECIENPVELINHVKNLATHTVIYEFKYEEMENVDPVWSRIWERVGLEFTLTREFDYVNDIFLGYATIHTCKMPYNNKDKEHPDAIR
jgi:hypothetical protein